MKRHEYIKEIQALSVDELKERARSMCEEIMKLRFRKATGQLEQGHRLGEVKKNLARVYTVLSAKQAAEAGAGE